MRPRHQTNNHHNISPTMESNEVNENPSLSLLKNLFFYFGLIFAQISNFFFWLEEAIPFEEFFIFDMFLIFSLFFLILKESGKIKHENNIINYACLLAVLNNFIATLFFFLWGVLFPKKDMAFVEMVGINGNFQALFDIISLLVFYHLFKKYSAKIDGLTPKKIVFTECYLILFLLSTLLFF